MRREAATTIADDLGWSPVSAEHPCPVCDAPSGCKTAPFRGGVAVDCRNVVSAWPMVDGGWLHRRPPDPPAAGRPDRTQGATCAFPVPAAGAAGSRRWSSARDAGQPPTVARETVLGAFATREQAEGALDALVAAGPDPGRLSALGRHDWLVESTRAQGTAGAIARAAQIGAAVGVGGAIALDFVAATIPGVGPVVALGPFLDSLSATLGSGLASDLAGFLAWHGVPEHEAVHYAERVRAGAYVVAVHTDDGPRAEAILTRSRAESPVRHVPD